MFKKKFYLPVLLLLVFSLLLGSCASPATPQASEPETVIETVIVEKEVVVTEVVEKIITPTPAPTATPQAGKTIITWWSHWANEPARRQVIDTIIADYEAAHPDVDILISWWDAVPLGDAVRAVMTAGEGGPDISTDVDMANMVKAGWVLDLEDALPWENYLDGVKAAGQVPGIEGTYTYAPGIQTLMLFYNPTIFEKLGIQVPESNQFTQAEFVEVVKKCKAGGYAGVADAVGNRNYPALFTIWASMVNLIGREAQNNYDIGLQSWDTPEARQVLNWMDELGKAGMWPSTFATMTIDEFHVYFHTQQKSCMLYIPSWYPGRAFKPEAEGGQSPDFQFKMMKYPLMDGAQFPNQLWTAPDSGYMVLSTSKHPDIAKDILAFMMQPKYGALWTALTNIPSSLKYDPVADWPKDLEGGDTWQWYWAEIDRVYQGMERKMATGAPCGDFLDARTNAINMGLPQGLLTVDEAIQMLDDKLCDAG
jgi:ABC-type glycerol-3-phosphate transport system substrate-binding protein